MAPKSPFPEFIPLTEDELQSLHCISMVDTSKVIAAAHIEKLRFIPDVLQRGFLYGVTRPRACHPHRPVVFSRPSEVKM